MKKRLVAISLSLVLVVSYGCATGEACPAQPAVEETASALLACIEGRSTVEELETYLRRWERIDDEWGGVAAADVLPAEGAELVVAYHADLQEASWNPQGHFVILAREGGHWRIAFDATELGLTVPGTSPAKEWDNWAYRTLESGDLTRDGLEDLLVRIAFSNGTHAAFGYTAVLSAHEGGELRPLFLEETPALATYGIVTASGRQALQRVRRHPTGGEVSRRIYLYQDGRFVESKLQVQPAQATAEAQLPDGSTWYAFDTGNVSGVDAHGLYRVQGDNVTHFPLELYVRRLAAGPDGALYAVVGCGLLRLADGVQETVAQPDDCGEESATGSGPLLDVAFGPGEGEVWVGGPFTLAHFDGGRWRAYQINAHRLLVTEEGNVWAAGWNGRAGSNCCFTNLTPTGETLTYTYGAALPVSPSLATTIRMLAPESP